MSSEQGIIYITPTIKDGKQCIRWGTDLDRKFTLIMDDPPRGKNAALLKFCEYIDGSRYDYLVNIDDDVHHIAGDIGSHLEERADVYFGIRKFSARSNLPSRIKGLWAECAALFLRAMQAPCGNFMAIRAESLDKARQVWETSTFDDLPLKKAGLKCKEIPIICTDTSPTNWLELWRFVVRQYVDVRFGYGGLALWLSWLVLLAIPVVLISYDPVVFFISYIFVSGILCRGGAFDALGTHALHLLAVPAAYLQRSFAWHGMRFKDMR